MHHRILLLTFPVLICASALSGCGGGGSADGQEAVTPAVLASSSANPNAPGQTKKTGSSGGTTTSGTTTTTTTTTADSGTTTPTTTTTTTTTPVASVPVYADGTARLNSMLASSLNVAIPSGVYMISGQLSVRNGQVIAPATGAQVTFKAAPGYTGSIISTVDQSFTVRGITFDGSYADRLSLEGIDGANLLNISGGSSITLENNTFQYAPAQAIWTYRSASMQIRGNTFLECWQPIRMDANNLQGGVIENNTFTNTTAYKSLQHITAINTVNLVVRGNTMSGAGLTEASSHGYEGTWGNSIYIFNSTGHLVELNTVSGNHWSALVSGQNATNGTIRGNKFGDGVGTAIAMWIEQIGAQNITVDSNQLDGGIFMGDTGGDYITVTNNTIRSRSVGIDVGFAAKHVTLQGNTISSKAGYRFNNGIYLWDKSSPDVNVQVLSNAISGFDKGIAVNNPNGTGTVYGITLSGNTFSDNNINVWVPSTITLNQPLGQ